LAKSRCPALAISVSLQKGDDQFCGGDEGVRIGFRYGLATLGLDGVNPTFPIRGWNREFEKYFLR